MAILVGSGVTTVNRRELRIITIQTLFQLDAQGDDYYAQLDSFITDRELSAAGEDFVRARIRAWSAHRAAIDQQLADVSEHWEIPRMPPIDRAILRLAVCELLYLKDPPRVVINEAVELAKSFGTAESSQFVNGLLDAIWKKHNNSN